MARIANIASYSAVTH